MKEIFEYIEQHRDACLKESFTFLRCESISTQGEGAKGCAGLLAGITEKSRIKASIHPTDRHLTVYGERIKDEALPTMLVYGHYDVRPPKPLGEQESEPFEPAIRDGRIFCRRISDNKSQLFTHIKTTQAWTEVKGRLPVDTKYLFEGEEGIESPDLLLFVESHKKLLEYDIRFYSGSHYHESGRPQINLSVKGLCYVEITLRETEIDLRSMTAICMQNPAWRIVKLLNTIQGVEGNTAIDGFCSDIRPLNQLGINAVSKIPSGNEVLKKQYGVDHFIKGRKSNNFYYNLIFEPTCNIVGISSGFTGNGSETVLPREATARIDMRPVPGQTPDKIYETLHRYLDNHGFEDAQLKHYGMITPSRTPIDHPYVGVAAQALCEGFHEEPVVFPGTEGIAPDFVFTGHLGVPSTVIPYAAANQKNHAPNESMVLGGSFKGIRASVALPYYLAKKTRVRT